MDVAGKHFLIVGLGTSGMALARFLTKRGASVTITDSADEKMLGRFAEEARDMGVCLETGGHKPETFDNPGTIILSPGVPHTITPVRKAMEKGTPVIGEIEFASYFIHEPIIAITGTNGKTTTTELTGEMLKYSGLNVFVGGNIGNPLISYADNDEKADIVVAEISSFQLDTTITFRPDVAVLLNITEDHLDRYSNFNAYAISKGSIFKNQKPQDAAIINGADAAVREVTRHIKSRIMNFNAGSKEETGAFISQDAIFLNMGADREYTLDISSSPISGRHNAENIAAASLAALASGGTISGITTALKRFKGLAHRLEYVCGLNGVDYYDDSKATNVDAVQRALETFSRPVVLIMGGRDKGGDYGVLKNLIQNRVKMLIVMGEAKDKIKNEFSAVVATKEASTMKEAVDIAFYEAQPGDAVVLSPACSSFDMFTSYAHRGTVFCGEIERLKGNRR